MGRFAQLGNDLHSGQRGIDFVARRLVLYAVSAVLIAIAVFGLSYKGLNLGIEFTGGWQITEAHRLKLMYAQVNGQSDTDDDGKVDTDLNGANISPDRYGIGWQARWNDKLHSLLQANHYASRSFDQPGLDFDGYTLVDATLGYRLPVGEARVGIENLFNEDYLTYYSQAANTGSDLTRNGRVFNGRGRTFTLGYQVSF